MLSAFLTVAAIFWLPMVLLWWIRSIPKTRTAAGGVIVVCAVSTLMMVTFIFIAMGFSVARQGG